MMVSSDVSRKSWIYLLVKKEDTYKAFKCFLADSSTNGRVEIVWSDGGGDSRSPFADVCIDNKIKREYTAVYSPRQKGSIERALSIVDTTRQAVRIQAQ